MENVSVKVTGASAITVFGHIRDIEDYQTIRKSLEALLARGHKSISIFVPDSLAITSSVIGYLLKLTMGEHIRVSMYVKDPKVYKLLDVLNLVPVFDVKMLGAANVHATDLALSRHAWGTGSLPAEEV